MHSRASRILLRITYSANDEKAPFTFALQRTHRYTSGRGHVPCVFFFKAQHNLTSTLISKDSVKQLSRANLSSRGIQPSSDSSSNRHNIQMRLQKVIQCLCVYALTVALPLVCAPALDKYFFLAVWCSFGPVGGPLGRCKHP